MAFARRAGEGSAREEVKASARARGSRGDDVREKERLEQDVGRETFIPKKICSLLAQPQLAERGVSSSRRPAPVRRGRVSFPRAPVHGDDESGD